MKAEMFRFEVKGLDEIEKQLAALPAEIETKFGKQAAQAAMSIALEDAKRRTKSQFGKYSHGGIAKSLELISGTSVDEGFFSKQRYVYGRIIARRTKGKHGRTPGGYYAWLVEKGHLLFRTTKWKKTLIKHVPPNPFMKPALEENAGAITERFRTELKTKIDEYGK